MKNNLSQQEINQIRDLACEGMLMKEAEAKQYYLQQIARIVVGKDIKEIIESAQSQGYNITEAKKPLQ